MDWRMRMTFLLIGVIAMVGTPLGGVEAVRQGIGDSYYPTWGNEGYDVLHYDLNLTVDVDANLISGATTITATAIEPLDVLSLDLRGLAVRSVTVDHDSVSFSRSEDNKLVIELPTAIPQDTDFTVEVFYEGTPEPFASQADPSVTIGWMHYADGVIVLGEPDGASTWFPVNNHPRDKASYAFHITVPKPYVVLANGTSQGTEEQGKAVTYHWAMNQPMASYLAVLSIAPYPIQTMTTPEGLLVHYQYAPELSAAVESQFSRTGEMITFFGSVYGPYPFDSYGAVVIDVNAAPDEQIQAEWKRVFGLETQTFTLFFLDEYIRENIAAHELAHQWFGNCVSLVEWRDLWLKEGFAVYSEWLWMERQDGAGAINAMIAGPDFYPSFLSNFEDFPAGNPPRENLYHGTAYIRGAMTLHALRLRIGDEAFFALVRAFVETYRYGNASTEDFITLAEATSGEDLGAFFETWLYSADLPSLSELGLG